MCLSLCQSLWLHCEHNLRCVCPCVNHCGCSVLLNGRCFSIAAIREGALWQQGMRRFEGCHGLQLIVCVCCEALLQDFPRLAYCGVARWFSAIDFQSGNGPPFRKVFGPPFYSDPRKHWHTRPCPYGLSCRQRALHSHRCVLAQTLACYADFWHASAAASVEGVAGGWGHGAASSEAAAAAAAGAPAARGCFGFGPVGRRRSRSGSLGRSRSRNRSGCFGFGPVGVGCFGFGLAGRQQPVGVGCFGFSLAWQGQASVC